MSEDRLRSQRRYGIHVPQLVGRISMPKHGEKPEIGLARIPGEFDSAMQELQRYLRYSQGTGDEAVVAGAFYAADPEEVSGTDAEPGDPSLGWAPGNHRHKADVGPAGSLGNANATGAGPLLAFNDHVHKRDVRVRHNGTVIGTRNALNFLGTGFTVVDDGANDEVEIGTASATPALDTKAVSTTPYTVLSTDFVLLVDATSGAITVNLPAASAGERWVTVKKIDAGGNAVTVDAAGSDLIDGAGTFGLAAQYNAVTIVSDGSAAWHVLGTV